VKICIVSDSHDRAPMLASAVAEGREADLALGGPATWLLADLSQADYEIRHLAA